MYSYDEDSMVLDPKLSDHLSHFGINMMAMSKVSESCNAQVLDCMQWLQLVKER